MPVVIRPSPEKVGVSQDPAVTTGAALLEATSRTWTTGRPATDNIFSRTNKRFGKDDRPVLETSFARDLADVPVATYRNGFVNGVIRAFNQDLHLVVRPDDVWLAVTTQFGMFVNGRAEEMRPFFVAHEGKKRLTVDVRPLSVSEAGVERIADAFTGEIQRNVVDPELREWMVPRFSTTTATDAAVASFAMMGAMKKYFDYVVACGCGFPSVTLLGERSDWEAIADRVAKLPRYGDEPAEWAALLAPVVRRMVRSFDEPDSRETRDFWLRVCHEAGSSGSGRGIVTLSGWITAFCFWDEDGRRIRGYSTEVLAGEERRGRETRWLTTSVEERRPLQLDGVAYPLISPKSVPQSVLTVPMVIEDYAAMEKKEVTVVAGHVGVRLTEGGRRAQPLSGWWMLLDESEKMEGA